MSIYNDDGAKREISVMKFNTIKEKTLRYFLVEENSKKIQKTKHFERYIDLAGPKAKISKQIC